MQSTNCSIRLAKSADADAIEALRLDAYARSSSITLLDNNAMAWSRVDERGLVLAIENELGQIVASIRGFRIENEQKFNELATAMVSPAIPFPCFYLASGCTAKGYEKQGLNLMLKLQFIKYLIASDCQALVQTIHSGTKRIARMEALGFRFSPAVVNPNIKGVYQYHNDFFLGLLPNHCFPAVFDSDSATIKSFFTLKKDVVSESQISLYLNKS